MNFNTFILIVIMLILAIIFATYYLIKTWKIPNPHCHCCGGETEPEWVCERCERFYCHNCSAPFTYMNQIDFPCCKDCEQLNFE